MARDKTTFIKLDRNILDWRWYKEPTTKTVFIHLLLRANIKDADFMTETIHRGELVTSYAALAAETGLSIKQVRTAIRHLKETGEVKVRGHSKFSIISMLRYDYYQALGNSQGHPEGKQGASKGQQSKNNKNIKEPKELHGAYANVEISGADYQDLVSAFGEEKLQELIEALSEYKEATGRTYQNDAAAIRTFARNRKPEREKSSFSKEY